MKIAFFGTPEFARTILAYLFEQKIEIVAVISRPDMPQGRSKKPVPTPVKEFALEHDLPLYQPLLASDPEFAAFLKGLNADFFIVAAYAEILKENVLNIPRYGCINVHASLLPKYRGAAPIQRAIMAGETESGVTIMQMTPKMDAGGVLAQCKVAIPLTMTTGELTEALAEEGKKALWTAMKQVQSGVAVPSTQDLSLVTFAKKLTLEDGYIDWKKPCYIVHNQIRGVTPKPGAWCWVMARGEKKRFLIKRSLPQPSIVSSPAQLTLTSNELFVGCSEGSVSLLEVQLEGKKQLPIKQFLQGLPADFRLI